VCATGFEFWQQALIRTRAREEIICTKLAALKREDPRGMRTRIEREQLVRGEAEVADLKIEDRMIAEDLRV
jgi:hypothetical protein